MTASLYIHIPFCAGSCAYCDFYSVAARADDPRIDRYLDRLLEDIARNFAEFGVSSVPSVYIGGGTPSFLGKSRLERLLSGLETLLPTEETREFTVEANPESADESFFTLCRAYGVNRVSLGIQTFSEKSRKAVNRVGGNLRENLERARAFYPENFSVDLIAGLPYQSRAVLRSDIERVIEFSPAHISLYALTLDENGGKGKITAPDSEIIDRLWLFGRYFLEKNGYEQYEISNFSLKGKVSAHNLRYWRMENWIGAGAGASGTLIDDETGAGVRLTVPADIDQYLNAPSREKEILDRETLIKESFLMGFRTIFGLDEKLFQKRFQKPVEEYIPHTIDLWRKRGLFEKDRICLSKKGLLFLNNFLAESFDELAKRCVI